MEKLVESGQCRAIGVSNFLERHLEPLLEHASIVPAVNQVEFNPYQNPESLHQLCRDHGIALEGYCPLGKGRVLNDPRLTEIASAYGKTPAQVLIRWSLQQGVVTIPKSRNVQHVEQNLDVFDFEIAEAHMEQMSHWHQNLRVTWDPSRVP